MSAPRCVYRCGVKTEVQDRRTGLRFTQVCVGTMSDAARPCPWLLTAGSIGDRISYTHSPILTSPAKGLKNPALTADGYTGDQEETGPVSKGQGREELHRRDRERGGGNPVNSGVNSSFALVTALSEPLEASICAELVQPRGVKPSPTNKTVVGRQPLLGDASPPPESSARSSGVSVILGPIVGRVDVTKQANGVRERCRVAVVVEVDGDSAVTCVVSLVKLEDGNKSPVTPKRVKIDFTETCQGYDRSVTPKRVKIDFTEAFQGED